MKNELATLDTGVVQSRLMELRGQRVLLDRDVAALYGVQTREITRQSETIPTSFRKDMFSSWKTGKSTL